MPGPWPLWRPPEAAISTSATSIGYQILGEYLSFHMRYCLLLWNEIGRSYTTFFQNGWIPPPPCIWKTKKPMSFRVKTTKFLVDDHKIVAQDYVQSSNFDSNINYLIEEIDYRIFAFKEPLFIKSCN